MKRIDHATPGLPGLDIFIPVIKLPQPDGSLLIRPGKPQVIEDELPAPKVAKLTGQSTRNIIRLCDEGHIQHRRKSNKPRSHYLIPRSEVERLRNIRHD